MNIDDWERAMYSMPALKEVILYRLQQCDRHLCLIAAMRVLGKELSSFYSGVAQQVERTNNLKRYTRGIGSTPISGALLKTFFTNPIYFSLTLR